MVRSPWWVIVAILAVFAAAAAGQAGGVGAADQAFAEGRFADAAKLYADAAAAEPNAGARAQILLKLARTHFELGNKARAREAVKSALTDDDSIEPSPDFYPADFIELFAGVRKELSKPPSATPTAPPVVRAPPAPGCSLAPLQQKLAQAVDSAALEAILTELKQLEVTCPTIAMDVLAAEADVLELLGQPDDSLELRGRVAAMRSAAQAVPGTSPIPHEAIMEARRLLAAGRPQDAVAMMRGVITALQSCGPALELLAEALLAADKLDDAASALKTAMSEREKPELLLLLGEVELRRGNFEPAREAFRRTVNLDPGSDRAWAALGLLAARKGDIQSAREALDKALAANGTLFEARVVRAQIALADSQAPAAIQHLQRALQVRPDDAWASGWMGVALLAAGRPDAALEKLRSFTSDPRSPFALALAEALRREGRPEDALATLAGRKGDDPASGLLRARCLIDVGKLGDAATLLQALAAASPQDGTVRYLLGYTYHRQRAWKQAVEELSRAASLERAPSFIKEAANLAAATAKAQELMDGAQFPPPPPVRK